jgi:predicted  nucleic acid-binding Zn-ribbon protein
MSASLGLFRLQQVDRQLDQARGRLTEIRRDLENDAELQAAVQRADDTHNQKNEADKNLREAEAQVKIQQVKIEQAESSLYGGGGRNPKELQELQNEVAALKRHLATLEERELEAMLQVEAGDAAHETTGAELKTLQARLGNQNGRLIEEQAKLEKDLERLNAERNAVVVALASQTLEMYENLRSERRGLAVAEVNDNSCAACGTTLTAALQQNARSTSQVAHCPSCGRILFAD